MKMCPKTIVMFDIVNNLFTVVTNYKSKLINNYILKRKYDG